MTDEQAAKLITLQSNFHHEPKVTIGIEMFTLLVKTALIHEEITMSRAAELLGLSLQEMRHLSTMWVEEC